MSKISNVSENLLAYSEKIERKIIVMCGSFNPPTIAHVKLMRCALDGISAAKGYVVPASQAYIKRKMIKSGMGHLCLPDRTRLDMLNASFADDERVIIYTDWLNETFAVTYEIMNKIQLLNPEAELYFLSGADKIALIEELCTKNDFLRKFKVIMFARNGDTPDKMIESSEILTRYKDSIVCLEQLDGIESISSTAIRKHLFDIGSVSDMLHPDAIKYIHALNKDDFPEEIVSFKDEYSFLDTVFPSRVDYEGVSYPSAESAFQASKLRNEAERKRFAECSPDKARSKGAGITPYNGWEDVRLSIMERIQESKFSGNPELRQKLLSTGSKKLIYGNKRKDTYWGVDPITWNGENNLGKLLMKTREKLTGGTDHEI